MFEIEGAPRSLKAVGRRWRNTGLNLSGILARLRRSVSLTFTVAAHTSAHAIGRGKIVLCFTVQSNPQHMKTEARNKEQGRLGVAKVT